MLKYKSFSSALGSLEIPQVVQRELKVYEDPKMNKMSKMRSQSAEMFERDNIEEPLSGNIAEINHELLGFRHTDLVEGQNFYHKLHRKNSISKEDIYNPKSPFDKAPALQKSHTVSQNSFPEVSKRATEGKEERNPRISIERLSDKLTSPKKDSSIQTKRLSVNSDLSSTLTEKRISKLMFERNAYETDVEKEIDLLQSMTCRNKDDKINKSNNFPDRKSLDSKPFLNRDMSKNSCVLEPVIEDENSQMFPSEKVIPEPEEEESTINGTSTKDVNININTKMGDGCNINVSNYVFHKNNYGRAPKECIPISKPGSTFTVNSLQEFLDVFECKITKESDESIEIMHYSSGSQIIAKGFLTEAFGYKRHIKLPNISHTSKSSSVASCSGSERRNTPRKKSQFKKSKKPRAKKEESKGKSSPKKISPKKKKLSPKKAPGKVSPKKMVPRKKSNNNLEEIINGLGLSSDDEFLDDLNELQTVSNESTPKELTHRNTTGSKDLKTIQKISLPEKPVFKNSISEGIPLFQKFSKVSSMKRGRVKLYDAQQEIENLQQELRLRDSEIQRLTITKQYSSDMPRCSFHLAFMFASPLVRKVKNKLENIMQLDYRNEITGIEKALSEVQHEIKYKINVATISNFRSIIADAPFALHFTGHGVPNNRQSLGESYNFYKDKGNILLLEDEKGMADYLFENDLKRLVKISKANRANTHNYEVVFVSSCHSEFAGKIFQASGANHVICILKSEQISDKASLRFSKVFYESLFMKKYSVCEAFKLAKEDIRTLFNATEAAKYILLLNEKVKVGKKFTHKCFPISEFNQGCLQKIESPPFFDIIPSLDHKFRGRQHEICEILTLLNENRLINILGPPGIGKTAIARNICHHLRDRKVFADGILHVGLRGCESSQMFLTRLSLSIISSAGEQGAELEGLQRQTSINERSESEGSYSTKEDERKMIQFMINLLRNKEMLLVLDNCEDPLADDCVQFVSQIDNILSECPKMKMLLTSRKYINKLEHNIEVPYHLNALSPQTSIKLLLEKVQRKISNQEIQELLHYKIPDDHPVHQHFPIIDISTTTLSNHPFTMLLGGHPQAIALAAPMLEHETLLELFKQLLDTNVMDALDYQEQQSFASLRMSLEISINSLKETGPEALDLFKMIGLLPAGIAQSDLDELWGDKNWATLKYQLIRASMIIFNQSENILTMLPFMNTRAIELLEQEESKKNEYHLKCCTFYMNFLKQFLEKINMNDFRLNDLVKIEANIWACIYRGINRKKDNDEYDLENPVFSPHDFRRSQTIEKFDNKLQLLASSPCQEVEQISPVHDGDDVIHEHDEELYSDSSDDLQRCTPLNKDNPLIVIKPVKKISSKKKDRRMSYRIPQFSKIKFNDSESEEFSDDSSSDSVEILELKKDQPKRTQSCFSKAPNQLAEALMKKKTLNKDILEGLSVFSHEEMLVMYYVSIGIRLCKLSDCRKAIKEYSKKENLSYKARGHLYQFQGLIALMNSKADKEEVENNFKSAIVQYENAKCLKGIAICKLGLLKTKMEFNHMTSPPKRSPTSKRTNRLAAINEIKELRQELEVLEFTLGLERLDKIEEGLNPKESNLKCSSKKFMRFKTLNRKYISELSQEDHHFDQNMLFNEDIILFTTVIEKDPKVKKIKISKSGKKFIIPNDEVRKYLQSVQPVISISIIPEENEIVLNSNSFDANRVSPLLSNVSLEVPSDTPECVYGGQRSPDPSLKELQGCKRLQKQKKNLKRFGYMHLSQSHNNL
ncbi:unnamed protein product [Moneuplotes crassus]|uniref:Orc1-like AAA ATPase domain-containing protein n=1 Tax=Euplotes crassus TaxID=5936 RepID=A0AAD1XVX4_EUPCR|nr:unnamed protein product [Moneuplotes crassus]